VAAAITELRCKEVRKVFGRQPALAGVSFVLGKGRLALLMGPNGAGKSTLLGILSTLSRPTSGQVLYGEHEHARAEAELRGKIGLLAHAPLLYRQLSSRENLRFFARLYGRSADEAEREVSAWLERVGMADDADKPVQALSRGMTQRVALARTLLPDPDLLLLDEPFTGLDRDAIELLRTELRTAREAGKIVVVVSHDLDAMGGLVDHLLVLRRGKLAADEQGQGLSAQDLLERYRAAL
jgi:heme exporter protein A